MTLLVQIFKRFHAAYMDAVSNPFYTTNTVRAKDAHLCPLLSNGMLCETGCICMQAITSQSFNASVRTIVMTV